MSRYMPDLVARLELAHCHDNTMVVAAWRRTMRRAGNVVNMHIGVERCFRHFCCDVVAQAETIGWVVTGDGTITKAHRFELPRDTLCLLYGYLANVDKVRMITLRGDSRDGRYACRCCVCSWSSRRRWTFEMQLIYGDKP